MARTRDVLRNALGRITQWQVLLSSDQAPVITRLHVAAGTPGEYGDEEIGEKDLAKIAWDFHTLLEKARDGVDREIDKSRMEDEDPDVDLEYEYEDEGDDPSVHEAVMMLVQARLDELEQRLRDQLQELKLKRKGFLGIYL
jgi:glutathione S-transferase